MHWKSTKLLPQLPDDTLPPATEVELRAHVASCARCRARLHRIQLSEDLVRRLPPAIVPVERSRDEYVRLAALARWTDDPEMTADPQGWRLSFLSVASILTIFCVAASAGAWAPTVRPGTSLGVHLDSLPPDSAYLAISSTNFR
jgi:anti-sigma factor RsiW